MKTTPTLRLRQVARLLALLLLGGTACAGGAAAAQRSARAQAPAPAASVEVERWNAGAERPLLTQGRQGEAVTRAQILLDRAWFSPGEIDGRFSSNMRRAVGAFQHARGLAPSGKVDAATWDALREGGGPMLSVHRITEADVAGPFAPIPSDMMERAKLKQLGWESAEEALGERFHMSPQLLRSLNRGRSMTAGSEIVVVDVATARSPATGGPASHSIRIDKSEHFLYVLAADEKVVAAFPISIGGPLDPLPVGRMKITSEVSDPRFTYDPALLKNARAGTTKTDIAPGPNNPVGNMWLGLSKPHWGIHGTPSPERVGHEETNGCIHLTNWDAHRVSTLIKAGAVVDVRE